MNIFKCFYASVAIAALAACTTDTDTNTDFSTKNNEIEVSTYIPGTRALDKTAFEEGDILELYACQTTGNYINVFNANFMNQVAVTRGTSGDWTYSPIMAWPTDENEKLSFVAFYPQKTVSGESKLYYTFTTNLDYTKQTDPLWCTIKNASINDRNGTSINGNESDAAFTPTSGALNLKFKHMLSKINVKVKLAESYPGITCYLKSMNLSDIYSSGTFKINNDLNSGSWSSNSPKTYNLLDNGKINLSTLDYAFDDLLLIPQNVSDNGACLNMTYVHTLEDGSEKEVYKHFYLPNFWEPNKTYNYSVVLSLNTNTITVSSAISDWDTPAITPSIGNKAPNAVDLGLSVKWAAYDFGAQSESDKGTNMKIRYSYKYDFTDTWGSKWRTPKKDEWEELLANCTITNKTVNGIDGYLVTGKNGNTIFLPNKKYATSYYSSGYTKTFYYTDLSANRTYSLSGDGDDYMGLRPVYTE